MSTINKLNLKLQGKDTTVLNFVDTLRAFVAKIKNWTSKVSLGNFAVFEIFSEVTDEKEQTDSCLQNEVIGHLQNLYQVFSSLFIYLFIYYFLNLFIYLFIIIIFFFSSLRIYPKGGRRCLPHNPPYGREMPNL